MPLPIYHIGINGFFGLLLRKWVDPVVVILASVIIDIEVLFAPTAIISHRYWHFHSFFIGGLVGALFGMTCWRFKRLFKWAMKLLSVPYETKLWKMTLAGILGVWIHVVIDAFYHWDVQPFWPYQKNVLRLLKSNIQQGVWQDMIRYICLAFTAAAILLYIHAVLEFYQNKRKNAETGQIPVEKVFPPQ